jgi:hypothetical protein
MDAYASPWDPYRPLDEADSIGIAGELCQSPNEQVCRKSERVPIEIGAGLRQRGASGVSVQVMDLSTHGFRVATHLELPIGTDVWLRLPKLEACHATVMWAQGHYVGCAFERPLHPAVLDMIVATRGR